MRELALVVLSCCGEDWLMVQPATDAARVAATAALAIRFMGIVSPYVARVWHNALQRKRDLLPGSSKPGKSRSVQCLPQEGKARDHHHDVQHVLEGGHAQPPADQWGEVGAAHNR